MKQKHSVSIAIVYAISLIGVFLIYQKAYAYDYVTVEASSTNAFADWDFIGVNSESVAQITASTKFRQPIETPISTTQSGAYDHWEIDDIKLYGAKTGGAVGADMTLWLEIENSNHVGFATSTIVGSITDTLTFPFDTVWVTSTTTADRIPKYLHYWYSCSGSCGTALWRSHGAFWYGFPYIGTYASTTPGALWESYAGQKYNGGYADVKYYDGSWHTIGTNDEVYHVQAPFSIHADSPQSQLSITYPHTGEEITGTFTMTGDCSEDFSLWLFNSLDPDSGMGVMQTIPCISGSWSVSSGVMYGGYWSLQVQDSVTTDSVVFHVTAMTPLPTSTPEFMSPLGSTTPTTTFSFLQDWSWRLRDSTRPWSYVPQLIYAIYDAIDSATSTAWLEPITFNVNGVTTTSGIGITTSTIAAISPTYTNTTRPLSATVFGAAFVMYLYTLARRFIFT